MPAMYGYFTLPERLYKDDNQVWRELSRVSLPSLSADDSNCYGIQPEVVKIYKKWLGALKHKRTNHEIHPLDFPLVRFCLDHKDGKGEANLFWPERPHIIHQIYTQFDTELADSFYEEISAQEGHQFMNHLCSLDAERECAEFLLREDNSAEIDRFHPTVNGKKGAFDVGFTLNGQRWYAEAKNILHEDSNLVFICHILAGILWLETEGEPLRRWSCISLTGKRIDYEFRNQVINTLRDNVCLIFHEINGSNRSCIKDMIGPLFFTKYQTSNNKMWVNLSLKGQDGKVISKVEFTLCRSAGSPSDTYKILPQPAYYSERLSDALWQKLDGKLADMDQKIKKHKVERSNCLAFVNLELHEKHCAAGPATDVEQVWKDSIQTRLDKETYPTVLHTRVLQRHNSRCTQKDLHIINKPASQAGFASAS